MRLVLAAILAVLLTGCADGRGDTRTFTLEHIEPEEALRLVEAYVPGGAENIRMTRTPAALTVTAPDARLQQVEDVLRAHDQPMPDVQLRFQVIEADGFTDADPAIADVQQALQQVFRFGGYRLGGEAVVRARAWSPMQQQILVGDQPYVLAGEVGRVIASSAGRAAELTVRLAGPTGDLLRTSVTIPDGQVVVVGSARSQAEGRTLILVVRAQIGGGAR
jgi:hypothetical protein